MLNTDTTCTRWRPEIVQLVLRIISRPYQVVRVVYSQTKIRVFPHHQSSLALINSIVTPWGKSKFSHYEFCSISAAYSGYATYLSM